MNNYAFTTLLATDDYLWGAVALYQSLKEVKSQYPFHLLVTDNISSESKAILDEIGIVYTIVPRVDFINQKNRYFVTYNKFHIYSLIQYDKVCFIDCDALVKTNIDTIFSNSAPGFVISGEDNYLSGVLILISPITKTLKDFEPYREECSADEQVWGQVYNYAEVSDLFDYLNKLIHRTDVLSSEDKYWKYYQLDSMSKVQEYLMQEYLSDFQLTFKACEIAHNKWLAIDTANIVNDIYPISEELEEEEIIESGDNGPDDGGPKGDFCESSVDKNI